MYGGSGKMGRGGGSASKRSIHAPPINRAAPTGRLSMGGGPRVRGAASSAAANSSPSTSSLQVEESFNLVRENPLNFGMAIKLAPDLVEEIKRVEAQGGTARIKFDANANNPSGNVICVGDKIFKFTWSREPGDLCDIYEERRSGDDGNGLLVESGGTWRKLNVERELDESTKNHVKRRSEEAERKHKARKAIILDHQNPVMKNQIKALAAAESNPWRNFKHRKEPPSKKLKSEPPSAGGPPKSVYKSGLTATTGSKSKISSVSPLPSQPDRHGASASPIGSGNLAKGHTGVPDVVPFQNMNKTANSDKEMQSKLPSSTLREKTKHSRNMEAKPADLRSLIISLLLENQSKGMSLKALEKATGDAMPNSAKQIEPILKQIATFQSPGRYFLKPGVEMDSFKKPPCQSGSSPEMNHQQSPISQKFDQLPAEDPSFSMRTAANDEEQGELSSPLHTVEGIEKIDILNSPEPNDKKNSENSENVVGSSSDSGSESDSDSDSSESGSDDSGSRSRSKSRSPVGSSSDSESDASSSSKQASDEDVDIMTSDDDKELKPKMPDSDPVSSKSPVQWSIQPYNESVDIGNYEKYDHSSGVIEIEKDSPEANCSIPSKEDKEPFEEIKPSSADHGEQQANQVGGQVAYNEPESVINEKLPKGKSKRRYEDKHSDERSHSKKKSKIKNLSQPVINSIFGESPSNSSPDRPLQDTEKGPINLMAETTGDGADNHNLHTGYNQVTPNRFPVSDSQQLVLRSSEAPSWTEAPCGEKRPGKHENWDRGVKYSERSFQTNDGEDGFAGERRQPKSTPEFHQRKPETSGKVKDAFLHSISYPRFSPKDNNPSTTNRSPLMNGRGAVLRREHSELELGEFREPDENPGPKKQFEKKRSFKQLENKSVDSQSWNADFSRGKLSNKVTPDPGKLSPPNSVSGVPDGPSKRKVPEPCADDLTKSYHKSTRPLNQNHQSWGDHIEHNKVTEMNKSRFAEAETGQGASVEAYGDISRKVSTDNATRGVNHHSTKESKKQKRNMVGDSNNRRKDASLSDGHKKKESSSDDNSCSYTKYEKEEPELKGPIKDASQYKEYVKEYQEKYDIYCSLNKILESDRDKFSKHGKDLEACKGSDMKRYHDILEQMRSSFRQCGERHKRFKKIFLVLYEELKHLKLMIKDYAASYKKD